MHLAFTRHAIPLRCRPARSRRAIVAVGALSALLLAGCSSGGSSTSTEKSSADSATAQDSAARDLAPGAVGTPGAKSQPGAPGAPFRAADGSTPAAPVPGVGAKLTKSASLDLMVEDIGAAAAVVRSTAAGLQAQVLSEQMGKGSPGDPVPLQGNTEPSGASGDFGGYGTLILSVPADKLNTALDQLAVRVGTVLRRNTSSQDVTSQYVDTESRLKTMRASVERVRALMTQAKDIGQIVALESEMSRRQADLESLESQLAALKTSVERSTVAVSLTSPANETVSANGFLAGLKSGWDAFTASAAGLLTAVGAALPFVVFLALLGAPLWWWWRRRRTNQPPAAPAPSGVTT